MKILVAMKQVPERDAVLRIAADAREIETPAGFAMNEPDGYALEEALTLKEKFGAEVIALTVGPERAASVLRDALARGADRALHVVTRDALAVDAFATAALLAAAVRAEFAAGLPELILTGPQSTDLGAGQTGVVLAELLGVPSATILVQVDVADSTLTVKRELEGGWYQQIEMTMPALLTIHSGSRPLRYATLMGIKKAKTKEVKVMDAAGLDAVGLGTAAPSVLLQRLYLPEKLKRTQMIGGSAQEAAAALVEKLRNEVRVL